MTISLFLCKMFSAKNKVTIIFLTDSNWNDASIMLILEFVRVLFILYSYSGFLLLVVSCTPLAH